MRDALVLMLTTLLATTSATGLLQAEECSASTRAWMPTGAEVATACSLALPRDGSLSVNETGGEEFCQFDFGGLATVAVSRMAWLESAEAGAKFELTAASADGAQTRGSAAEVRRVPWASGEAYQVVGRRGNDAVASSYWLTTKRGVFDVVLWTSANRELPPATADPCAEKVIRNIVMRIESAPPERHVVRAISDDLCFVRANEDDVPDIVLWSGAWNAARLVAIDGKTGEGLWTTHEIPQMGDSYLHCADPLTVVVGVLDFTVRGLAADSGRERWRAKVSDMPKKAAAGPGCLLVQSQDGEKVGLSIDAGKPVRCATKEEPSNFRLRQSSRAKQSFDLAGLTLTVNTKAQGTPMLTLVATRGKQAVWQTPLGVYSNTPWAMSGLIAHTDRVVVVGGRNLSGDISVALVALDPLSGRQLWKKDSSSIEFLVSSGSRLYAGLGGRVKAIDPATGDDLWEATTAGAATEQ